LTPAGSHTVLILWCGASAFRTAFSPASSRFRALALGACFISSGHIYHLPPVKTVASDRSGKTCFFKKAFGKKKASPYELDLVINSDFIAKPDGAKLLFFQFLCSIIMVFFYKS
jgi:hypothetical protein